jgi:membrane protein DedA with SNARE-associated domain
VVLVAVVAVLASNVARLVGAAMDAGVLAYLGLMGVCWVGAGGALVPVPGVRPLSWVMIVHQSTVLAAPIVVVVAAVAMALGQSSYFVATRIETRRLQEGHGHHHHGHLRVPVGSETSTGVGSNGTGARSSGGVAARSRALLESGRAAVTRRMTTHPQRIVFLLCVLPNPLTTFATVSAASSRVPFGRFFAASLAGFLVLSTALAVAGQGILAILGIS